MAAMFSASRATIRKAMVVSHSICNGTARALRRAQERPRNSKKKARMSTNSGPRFGLLALAILAGAVFVAPGALATPVTYDFTVEFLLPYPQLYGPLAGTTETGTFTFDSSSITPSVSNAAPGLLTALDFWHNGIHYDETTANTGSLFFDPAGNLQSFVFGTNCSLVTHDCYEDLYSNEWAARPGHWGFVYATPADDQNVWNGDLTFALVPYVPPGPTPVPEPGALGTMVAGLALLATLYRRRRLS